MYFNVVGVDSAAVNLQILTKVGGAFGGEKFTIQPIIQVVDSEGVQIRSFVGSVSVLMTSDSREPLYLVDSNVLGCDVDGDCGTRVTGRVASVKIIEGVGTFQVPKVYMCIA